MMTAQQWNQQQRSYNRNYSIDVAPKTGSHRSSDITAADKKRMIMLVLVIGLICIGMVISSAFVASVTYQNNQLKASNEALQSEVDTLQTKLDGATNTSTIAVKASKSLGMVYPSGKKYVQLTTADKPQDNFAGLLKKQAFD
mgnify:CR=1 FL=1|jgi:Cell division protein